MENRNLKDLTNGAEPILLGLLGFFLKILPDIIRIRLWYDPKVPAGRRLGRVDIPGISGYINMELSALDYLLLRGHFEI